MRSYGNGFSFFCLLMGLERLYEPSVATLCSFLLVNLSQFVEQIFSTQVARNDDALRVEEHVAWDAVYTKGFMGSTLPALQIAHLRPCQPQVVDALLPGFYLAVEAYTYYLKTLAVIHLIGLLYVRHFHATRTAP